MKGKIRITILLVLAVQVMAILIYSGMVVAATDNNVSIHANLTTTLNATCTACHPKQRNERSLGVVPATRILTAHRRHQVTGFLRFQCRTCHTSAELGNDDSVTTGYVVRKQVDPALCLRCHGAFNTAAGGLAGHNGRTIGADTAMSSRSCTVCHAAGGGLDPVVAHTYSTVTGNTSSLLKTAGMGITVFKGGINVKRASNRRFCTRCHGELKLYEATETNPNN